MDTPYGPHRITGNRQVAIPKDLTDLLSLRTGDKVYFLANLDEGTITIVPVELLTQWLDRGRAGHKAGLPEETTHD